MGRFFFRGNAHLFKYEKIMQQVPLFDTKKENEKIYDFDNDDNGDITFRIIDIETPEGIKEEYENFRMKEFFLNENHKKTFARIYRGPKGKRMKVSSRYAAAIYFLSADENLWNMCMNKVAEFGIFFREMKLKGIDLNGYILLQAAKSVYYGYSFIHEDELADMEIVDKDMLRVIANGFHVLREGNFIMREAIRGL